MRLFKSREEKLEESKDKIKENWKSYSHYKLGVSYEQHLELLKEFEKSMIDAKDENGIIYDWKLISALFPDLDAAGKWKVLMFAQWAEDLERQK